MSWSELRKVLTASSSESLPVERLSPMRVHLAAADLQLASNQLYALSCMLRDCTWLFNWGGKYAWDELFYETVPVKYYGVAPCQNSLSKLLERYGDHIKRVDNINVME